MMIDQPCCRAHSPHEQKEWAHAPICQLQPGHDGSHAYRSLTSDYPFADIVASIEKKLRDDPTLLIFQKWTCSHCGARQTMETPNQLYMTGRCEECRQVTDITANGCNYLLIMRKSE